MPYCITESKLNLDPKKVDHARASARKIAESMQEFIDRHTTVSTERTILRLLGVDGVDELNYGQKMPYCITANAINWGLPGSVALPGRCSRRNKAITP